MHFRMYSLNNSHCNYNKHLNFFTKIAQYTLHFQTINTAKEIRKNGDYHRVNIFVKLTGAFVMLV